MLSPTTCVHRSIISAPNNTMISRNFKHKNKIFLLDRQQQNDQHHSINITYQLRDSYQWISPTYCPTPPSSQAVFPRQEKNITKKGRRGTNRPHPLNADTVCFHYLSHILLVITFYTHLCIVTRMVGYLYCNTHGWISVL